MNLENTTEFMFIFSFSIWLAAVITATIQVTKTYTESKEQAKLREQRFFQSALK